MLDIRACQVVDLVLVWVTAVREIEESCGVRLGVYANSTTAEGALIVAMHGRAQLLERELPSRQPSVMVGTRRIHRSLCAQLKPAAKHTAARM